ncbi:thymidylate synthase [Pedomonas sp. V897]|uniref:thymidylate synthase n=1 Tax=Pedomonas sp. V897 TaxID=3446482 RepID=UPI003EE28189
MTTHPEFQYLDLLRRLLEEGDRRMDRTGVGTRSLFGEVLRFDLSQGLPLLTTKQVFWKPAVREMLWFLTGDTNIRPLVAQGVKIWTDWPLARYRKATGEDITQAEFEKRIVEDEAFAKAWGDLGPVYGKQWRRWQGPDGREHDQIATLIREIRANPASRRLLFTGWNVAELEGMALPPCHMTYQFHVTSGADGRPPRLSCALYQRSADIFLGVPFNLFEAALLTHMIAQQCDLAVGTLVWFGGDVHLYSNAEEQAREQMTRDPRPFPQLKILRRPESIDGYVFEDFAIEGYDPHPPLRAPVAV